MRTWMPDMANTTTACIWRCRWNWSIRQYLADGCWSNRLFKVSWLYCHISCSKNSLRPWVNEAWVDGCVTVIVQSSEKRYVENEKQRCRLCHGWIASGAWALEQHKAHCNKTQRLSCSFGGNKRPPAGCCWVPCLRVRAMVGCYLLMPWLGGYCWVP